MRRAWVVWFCLISSTKEARVSTVRARLSPSCASVRLLVMASSSRAGATAGVMGSHSVCNQCWKPPGSWRPAWLLLGRSLLYDVKLIKCTYYYIINKTVEIILYDSFLDYNRLFYFLQTSIRTFHKATLKCRQVCCW